ncbi:histidine phosphatase family protein [Paenibacillus terrigena]|uniref:histidine phosphatase family protein n=1 Tax=Paenibacillus terrigena TaxID=369333 RepID=UPI0028D3D436|nr:histidine phosphatase family protein [Paenibacillus terrigena]
MKNIYVVRHCKAAGQAADAPLTEIGNEQAQTLAEFLADKNIDYIVTSPYVRAYHTIAPFADQQGIDIHMDDRLTERVLSGQDCPDWMDMLRATYDDLDLCYEGGESSRVAMHRAVQVVTDVLGHSCKNAVVVSHGNLISLLLKHFDDRYGFFEWQALSNPDVYQLSFDNERPTIQRIWTA